MHRQHPAPPAAPALDRETIRIGAVVVLGAILAILDATIVNVAIPAIGADLRAPVGSIGWVMTAYLLAFASVIPLGAWAMERFGARRVFLAALVVFLAGSALAAAAPSLPALVAFRVVQGLGGGLIMPVGQAILARAAGPERVGRAMTLVGVPMLLAPIFGPVIGGVLVDAVAWRAIFAVNLPLGAVALAAAWRILPAAPTRAAAPLDARGLVLLVPGIATFVYGMSEASYGGGLGGARTLGGVAVGAALGAAFALHARRRGAGALLDVSLFARRGFAAAAATNLLIGIALFGALLLVPLYLQLARGASPLEAGLLLAPQGIGAAIAMPLAGWLTDAIGARRVIPVGILAALAGTAGLTQVGAGTSYVALDAALVLIGLGLGATIMPSMAVAYRSVDRAAVAQATSAINVVQRVAGSVGTALAAVVLQRQIGGAAGGPALAGAFGTPFAVALGVLALALVPALALPRLRERAPEGPAATSRREPTVV